MISFAATTFLKVGILVKKVGILEETSFGVKNSTVTARSSSPRAKVDSERRSRRQHRILRSSVRYERAITGDRPAGAPRTNVNGERRAYADVTSALTKVGTADEIFQPESRLSRRIEVQA